MGGAAAAVLCPGLLDMMGVPVVEGIVFRHDSGDLHTQRSSLVGIICILA